ncbi:MAG: creatininase family protein [Verrucomicrobiota bacterium]
MMSSSLANLTWPAIKALQEEGRDMLVLPCGATEQHGSHLPVNTDTVIAEAVCRAAGEKAGIAVLPPLAFTVSVGHTAKWPGTFSLSHETFIQTVCEIADWAAITGWKRLLLVNSHFGNDASLRVAVDKVRTSKMGDFQIGWRHTFSLTDEIWSYFISDGDDVHANKAETDLMLHLAPQTVVMEAVEDDPDRTAGTIFSYPVAQTSRNGVTGSPSLGSAEAGEKLFKSMVEALAQVLKAAAVETPPLTLTELP